MHWTKLSLIILFLFVIFTVSIFGGYAGYTVDGVPRAGAIEYEVYDAVPIHDVDDYEMLPDGTWRLKDVGTLEGAKDFMGDMVTFQIDDMPTEISAVFIIMSLMIIYMIASMFFPGGSG